MKITVNYYGIDDLDENCNPIKEKEKTFTVEGSSKEEINNKALEMLNDIIKKEGFIAYWNTVFSV